MNVFKFLLYGSAITITLGILSEDEEIRSYFKDLIKDIEPQLKEFLKKIDKFLADENNMDLSKVNLVIQEKLDKIDEIVQEIKKNKNINVDRARIKKLQKVLNTLEKEAQKEEKNPNLKKSKTTKKILQTIKKTTK